MGNTNNTEKIKKIVGIGIITVGCFIGGVLVSNVNLNKYSDSSTIHSTNDNSIANEQKTESYAESQVDDASESKNIIIVDNIPTQTYAIDRIEIQKITDKISTDNERKQYEINTSISGRYRFELSDVPQNVQFTMYVYNSEMEQLAKEYDKNNGRGITIDLDGNSTYYVVVEQEDNAGSYILNIGMPKNTVDITNYNQISDSIQYNSQRNTYLFTSGESGTYRFDFSDIPQNIQFTMYVYNSNMEQLAKEYDRQNDRGISIDLVSNTMYYIVVEQEDNVGSYKLNIGCQKPILDISDVTSVNDSIQFASQRNIYMFTPKFNSIYYIGFSNVSNDAQFTLYVYNSNWEQLSKEYDRTNDRGLLCNMEKDSLYYVVVQQEDSSGTYRLTCELDTEKK